MKTPRIKDCETYWRQAPPQPSARLLEWQQRIKDGWRPNARIGSFGYHESAAWYGVYIWEWINVLEPLIYSNAL